MNPFLTRARAFVLRYKLLLAIALIFIVMVIGYVMGYRPGPGFTLVREGTVVLTNVPVGAVVYADESKRAVGKGTDVRVALVPGNHLLIVDSAGNNPWSDLIDVPSRVDTKVTPVLVPLKVTRVAVAEADLAKANAALAASVLPTAQAPLLLDGGCAGVVVSQNRIVASVASTTGCTPPPYLCVGGTCATTVIFAPVAPLRSVLAYPGREDTLIVAYGDTIAVIELNPLRPQFFAPLLRGTAPKAALWDEAHILVRDGTRTFTVGLQGSPAAPEAK